MYASPAGITTASTPIELAALGHQAVGAGAGHPGNSADVLRRQQHAIGHQAVAFGIVVAAAAFEIEQPAGHASGLDNAGVDVFQFVEAALAAAVA